MMTLNEAIRHAEEKACGNTGCAEEYRQLGEWLRELKDLRSAYRRLANTIVCSRLLVESYQRFIQEKTERRL